MGDGWETGDGPARRRRPDPATCAQVPELGGRHRWGARHGGPRRVHLLRYGGLGHPQEGTSAEPPELAGERHHARGPSALSRDGSRQVGGAGEVPVLTLAPAPVRPPQRWVTSRQMCFEGGFQGRCNKLVDGCYSFWQAGLLPLLHRALHARGESAVGGGGGDVPAFSAPKTASRKGGRCFHEGTKHRVTRASSTSVLRGGRLVLSHGLFGSEARLSAGPGPWWFPGMCGKAPGGVCGSLPLWDPLAPAISPASPSRRHGAQHGTLDVSPVGVAGIHPPVLPVPGWGAAR